MKPTPTQHNDFLSNRPLSGVALSCSDYVNVTAGQAAGESGTIVDLEELGEDPIYLVELDGGEDMRVPQSQLQHAGES
jgi:hypothetical protein